MRTEPPPRFAARVARGLKDGFLFALELAPSVILSLGIISITDGLGGLRAAQQLMTPVLKPLLGIPRDLLAGADR